MKAQDGKPVSQTFIFVGNRQVREKDRVIYETDGTGAYDKYLASLPRYPFINNSGKEYKVGEEVEGEIAYQFKPDKEFIWRDTDHDWYNNIRPEYRRIVVRSVSQPAEKPDCSQHPKDLFGHSDMEEVAEAIGNLHYETLAELLEKLTDKLYLDSAKDFGVGRKRLGDMLHFAADAIYDGHIHIEEAFEISKPFMKK